MREHWRKRGALAASGIVATAFVAGGVVVWA